MALFAAQLQPWEENQSPSPTETSDQNPYELSLARSRSSSSKSGGHNQTPSSDSHNNKPSSPINTLHRQLSGDPEAPPPAWKRRSSVNGRTPSSGPPSASRRHPGLLMTLSSTRQQLPEQMFIHESPNSSSTDLAELGLPQPAFRRRSNASGTGLSSNRSSMHSLTSEELWKMDQEANQPDLSNPTRQAKERPLDTVRRLSRGYDMPTMSQLPGEVIWPSAMGDESPNQLNAALRSNSTTSISKVNAAKRLTIRKRPSRDHSFDTPPNEGVYLHSPNSLSRPESMIITSSAHSSTTSLNSQGFSPLKTGGNRPPSAYYSRDFLSSLAPREGGYAIAATMGNGLGAHGAMSVDERRRSQVPDRRAPMAKSAGMGRWSLDGGEHYARPYGTPSAATTASNLSAPPLTSPNVSPPVAEIHLPEGASAPYSSHHTIEPESTPPSIPTNPSPLSQHTHSDDVHAPQGQGERAPAPIPLPTAANDSSKMPQTVSAAAAVATPGLKSKMSKKDLKAAKVEAAKIEHIRKAEEKAAVAKAKADKKQAEIKAKEEMKRKEKEEKERRKAEKKAKKTVITPVAQKPQTPFPRTSAPVPAPPVSPPRRTAQSMPLGTTPPPSSLGNQNGGQSVRTKASESTLRNSTKQPSKLGFLGTLKKRFSSGPSTSLAEVRRRHESDAANIGSMPPPHNSASDFSPSNGTPQTPKEVRTSSMAAGAFSTPPPAQDFAPSSLPPVDQTAPLDLAPIVSTTEELSSPTNEEQRSTSTLIPRQEPTPSSPPSRSLAKVQSRDQTSIRSSNSHSRTRSASLHGPRPMPRPESINLAQPIPSTETNGFPFRPTDLVTPTTSAESSMFSNISQGEGDGDASSPFTSIDSRKNSLDGTAALDSTDNEGGLERQDSTTPKASDETETRRAVAV